MDNKITLYHGSASIVRVPDLTLSREEIDFGRGFYMSPEANMSAKWACRTASSIVNEYELSLNGLKVYHFNLDEEWLNYIVACRRLYELDGKLAEISKCDVLIGAVADDKLFATLDMYEDGYISAEKAVEIMNCMKYSEQYVLKTDNAIKNLHYLGHIRILGEKRDYFKKMFREDQKEATKRTAELLRKDNGR